MIDSDTLRVAVIGKGLCSQEEYETAYDLGCLLAEANAIVFCGGREGMIEGCCKGIFERGGIVVGFLPTPDVPKNPYLTVPIYTSFGLIGNYLIVENSDVVIALPGNSGTLAEVAHSLLLRKTTISLLDGWHLDGVIQAASPQEAIYYALQSNRETALV